METNNDFARSLALLRREKGVSQRTAAKDLGISQALLSHYENGIREPGLNFVCRVCDYYHVSADFLLGRSMNRDGLIIGVDELYDESEHQNYAIHGSISTTLNKKLLINSVSILFDLLGETGGKTSVQAAANCLSNTLYKLFRHLYRVSGTQDENFFSISTFNFLAGYVSADMICCEADYVSALNEQLKENGKDSFPAMNNDALIKNYPGSYQSLLQLLHFTAQRVKHNTEERWSAKNNK